MSSTYFFRSLLSTAGLLVATSSAQAAVYSVPATGPFTIANDLGSLSITSGPTMHVGRVGGVYYDGFIEFDIRGLTAGKASFSFDYTGVMGSDFFAVSISDYAGDGLAKLSDFTAEPIHQVAGFSGFGVGQRISFDDFSYSFIQAQYLGLSYLGFRFEGQAPYVGGTEPAKLKSFGNFLLTVDTSVPLPPKPVPSIPEPETYAMLGLGFGMLALRLRIRLASSKLDALA